MVYSIVEESIVKWFWGSLGLCVCAVPVFGARLFGGGGGLGVLANVDFGSRTEGDLGTPARLSPGLLRRTDG